MKKSGRMRHLAGVGSRQVTSGRALRVCGPWMGAQCLYPEDTDGMGILPQPTPSSTPGAPKGTGTQKQSERTYILESALDVQALMPKNPPRNRAMRLLVWYLNRLPPDPVVRVSWNLERSPDRTAKPLEDLERVEMMIARCGKAEHEVGDPLGASVVHIRFCWTRRVTWSDSAGGSR